MTSKYEGFSIEVKPSKINGEKAWSYSIVQDSDGFEVSSGLSFEGKMSTLKNYLKGIVDDFLADPTPYLSGYSDENPDQEYLEEDIEFEPPEETEEQ